MNTLIIGRFQVLHNGHVDMFKKAQALGNKLIIGIGSSDKSRTTKNPFTAEERTMMVSAALDMLGIVEYVIYYIPDINDTERYVSHVESIIPEISAFGTTIVSGNPYTFKCFEDKGYKINQITDFEIFCASDLREMIAEDNPYWMRCVPGTTIDTLDKMNGAEIIRRCFRLGNTPV
jgi:nicotinamide-nucleotide adenylyltransferase